MEHSLLRAFIDLDAIAHNVEQLKAKTKDHVLFMAVVKADGYGHGAVRVAQKALLSGAKWLGVARMEEAAAIREAGIKAPMLVFGYVYPDQVDKAKTLDLTLTVYDLDMARQLSDQTGTSDPIPVHLKVDTGMGRVGMIIPGIRDEKQGNETDPAVLDNIERISRLPGLDLKGIYTHFAAADSADKTYTQTQIEIFNRLLLDLKQRGIEFELRHAANSAGIIAHPHSHFDMVRAGISLYGLNPSKETGPGQVALKPAMKLVSIISGVRDVPKGFCVSYGMTYRTDAPTRLASVPVGYADGFSRKFSSNGEMLVKGRKTPVVGRVCMDQTMIDVGHIPDVVPGDEVVLIGEQLGSVIRADDLADRVSTINYEIVSALTQRVQRIYSDSGGGSG